MRIHIEIAYRTVKMPKRMDSRNKATSWIDVAWMRVRDRPIEYQDAPELSAKER